MRLKATIKFSMRPSSLRRKCSPHPWSKGGRSIARRLHASTKQVWINTNCWRRRYMNTWKGYYYGWYHVLTIWTKSWVHLRRQLENRKRQTATSCLKNFELQLLNQGFPTFLWPCTPFTISTDEHVPQKFLMTKRLSKITKIHWILLERLDF